QKLLVLSLLIDEQGRPVVNEIPWFRPGELPEHKMTRILNSVPSWRFTPAMRLGSPHAVWINMDFSFNPCRPAAPRPSGRKQMSKAYEIAVIPGDGIGPEVVREGLRVLERVASIEGFRARPVSYPFGAEHYLKTKEIFPESAFTEVKGQRAILLGAIGDPRIEI